MKTLEQIKEEVSQDDNFQGRQELFESCARYDYVRLENAINEISQRYATEYAKEALKNASENARVMTKNIDTENELEVLSWTDSRNVKFSVSKQSILSEDNLPKH